MIKICLNKFFCLALALSAGIYLVGCQNMPADQRVALGTTFGSVAGALAGSQVGDGRGRIVAMAIGAAVGGYVGNQFAHYLNAREQESLARSTEQALAANENSSGIVPWQSDVRRGVDGRVEYSQAVASNDRNASGRLSGSMGQKLDNNTQQKLAQLPPGTVCRATRTSLSVEDRNVANGAIWCRTAGGDYKPLETLTA